MNDHDRFPIPTEWIAEEGALLAAQVARWAEREVTAKRHALREDFAALHAPAWAALMREVGLRDLLWPEAGDDGLATATTLAAVIEQVGRADTGLGVLLANTWALATCVPPALAPRLGERGAVAALVLAGYGGVRPGETPPERPDPAGREPSAAFHGLTPQVRACAREGGWELSGHGVRPQAHGAEAAWFGVLAEVEGAPALFAVPASARGLTREPVFLKAGLHGSRNADLTLKAVAVDAGQRLLAGEGPVRGVVARYLLGCAAAAQGGLLALHTILDDWCESQVIKGRGQPFKENPLVAALLGEIGGTIGTGRVLLYQLARLLETADPGAEATHATATALARAVLRGASGCFDHGMELMASAGYATEWNLERYWRDVRTLCTYLMLETAGQMDLARHYFGCRSL